MRRAVVRREQLAAQEDRRQAALRLAARHRERLAGQEAASARRREVARQAAVLADLGVERLAAQIRQAAGVPGPALAGLEQALEPVVAGLRQAVAALGPMAAGLEQGLRQAAGPVADLLEVYHRSRLTDLETGARWAAAQMAPSWEVYPAAVPRLAAAQHQALADLGLGQHPADPDQMRADLERANQVAHQVVRPVAGPAQLWAAPLGTDPADLARWVYLGPAGPVEVPAESVVLADPVWRGRPVPARPAGAQDWAQVHREQERRDRLPAGQVAWPVEYPVLEEYPDLPVRPVHPGWGEVPSRPVGVPGLDWRLEAVRQEEDRCPVGLGLAGLAGVLVPRREAADLGLCPCRRCRPGGPGHRG